MKKLLFAFVVIFASLSSFAQINVTSSANATLLANKLIGAGVNVTNATINCPPLASGHFTVTSSNLGLDSGIVLTTGVADSTSFSTGINGPALGPSTDNNALGDADLTLLCGQTTNDACILEFDFETTGDSIKFDYVFGSSEYPNFTCSNYNDVFGFFVSGPGIAGPYSNGAINIANVPGSTTCPVGVSTIYCPTPGSNCCNTANANCYNLTTGCGAFNATNNTCAYFVCNDTGTTVNYQGFTTVLRAEAQIQPCTTYHFKLAIADAFDGILDSGIMLEAGSFTANSVGLDLDTSLLSATGNPIIIEGCDSITLDIKIQKFGVNTFDTVNFTIQGSAINGGDYNPIPNYLVFSPNPNDTIQTITIGAIADGITEGTENIIIYLQNYCSTALADSIVIEIIDDIGAGFFVANNAPTAFTDSICLGYEFTFVPFTSPIVGIGPLTYNWDFGDGTTVLNAANVNQRKTYTQPGTYTVKLLVVDSTGCTDSAIRNVLVDFPPYIEFSASPLEICSGEGIDFIDSVAPGTRKTIYDFGDGIVLQDKHNPSHVYDHPGNYTVTFTGEYLICPSLDSTIDITVNEYPLINLGEDQTFCPGLDTAIILSDINNPSQIMTWSTGEIAASIITNKTGYYWASLDNEGCSATDSIWVKRNCYLNIPNGFTPNGDGSNDYFIPRQLLSSGLIDFDMKIMNRWGEVIFVTDKLDGRGWDGRYSDKDQPVGVYIYQINAQWENGYRNSFRGNLTLLR